MRKFEILPDGSVQATASTRAGLFTAALQGVFAGNEPFAGEDTDEKIERPFKLAAQEPGVLLALLLEEAIKAAHANGEVFDNVSFTLVTDKKAEGSFIGSRGKPPAARSVQEPITMEKNEIGEWETIIRFA